VEPEGSSPPAICPYSTFKRTYERCGLEDGEEKLRIETSGDE
jgi:hypothetical protein